MDRQSGFSHFLLGLGIGAASAILFAPKKGLETRSYLRAKAQEGADYVKQQGDALVEQAAERIQPLKQDLQRPIEAVADAIAAGQRAYRETIQNYQRTQA